MNEVYRATDIKLKRDVALKVLPDSVADDADRLPRFQREPVPRAKERDRRRGPALRYRDELGGGAQAPRSE